MQLQGTPEEIHQLLREFGSLDVNPTTQATHVSRLENLHGRIKSLFQNSHLHVTEDNLAGLLKLRHILHASPSGYTQEIQTIEKLLVKVLGTLDHSLFLSSLEGNCRAVAAVADHLHNAIPANTKVLSLFLENSTQEAKALFWMYNLAKGWANDYPPILHLDLIFDYRLLYVVAPFALKNSKSPVPDLLHEFTKLLLATSSPRSIVISALDRPQKASKELLQAVNRATELQELTLSGFSEVDLATLNLSKLTQLQTLTLPMKDRDVELLIRGNLLTKMPQLAHLNIITPNPALLATPRTIELLVDCNKLSARVCGHLFEQGDISWNQLRNIKQAHFVQDPETKGEILRKFSMSESSQNQLQELGVLADQPLDLDFLSHLLMQLPRLNSLRLSCQAPSAVAALDTVIAKLTQLDLDLHPEAVESLISLFEQKGEQLKIETLSITFDSGAFPERLMRAIAKLPTLKSLTIRAKGLSDSCIDELSQRTTLEKLSIAFPKRVQHVDRTLYFMANRLERLAKMPQLRQCSIDGNPLISYREAYAILQQAPSLNLSFRRYDALPQPGDTA